MTGARGARAGPGAPLRADAGRGRHSRQTPTFQEQSRRRPERGLRLSRPRKPTIPRRGAHPAARLLPRDYEARHAPRLPRGACRELQSGRPGQRRRRRPADYEARQAVRAGAHAPPFVLATAPARRPCHPRPRHRAPPRSRRPPAATYVYGEAFGVLQVAEDLIGRQRDALVQAVPAAPAAALSTLRHFECAQPASSAMEIYAHIFDC